MFIVTSKFSDTLIHQKTDKKWQRKCWKWQNNHLIPRFINIIDKIIVLVSVIVVVVGADLRRLHWWAEACSVVSIAVVTVPVAAMTIAVLPIAIVTFATTHMGQWSWATVHIAWSGSHNIFFFKKGQQFSWQS